MPTDLPVACLQILYQVQSSLAEIVEAKEVGTITIHCGKNDLAVEVIRKLKAVPLKENPPA